MNSQEREIISGIFQRLEQAANQPREPEAERFIAEKVRQQPYAPYAMAQSLYVQEEAVKSLGQQVEQLKAEIEQLRAQAPQSGGFLSSLFGGAKPQAGPSFGGRQDSPQQGYASQQGYAPQQAGPWGGAAQGGPQGPQGGGPWGGQQQGGFAQQQPSRGSGFLGSALTTAAGVAGGMVVGNALMGAFSGGHHALGGGSGSGAAAGAGGETMVNNYESGTSGSGSNEFQNASYDNAGESQDASYQDASYDDGGSSGSDDWA